jgi:TldD protein
MPNVSLQHGTTDLSLDDIIGGVDDGLLILGDNSWSIDMQRYNFQFTGQRTYRIRNGRCVGQVRNAAYQSSTPEFWHSLSALGGPRTAMLGGVVNCGKGQPGQAAPVTHGCPVARFDGISVLNTEREGGR